jgi:hypothetical protein
LWAESVPGAEMHCRLSAQYGISALLQQSMYDWIIMLKNGCTNVTDEDPEVTCPNQLQKKTPNKSMP